MTKTLLWFFLLWEGSALPWTLFLRNLVTTTLLAGAAAWFLFHIMVWWDDFFQHAIDESRDLRPDFVGK